RPSRAPAVRARPHDRGGGRASARGPAPLLRARHARARAAARAIARNRLTGAQRGGGGFDAGAGAVVPAVAGGASVSIGTPGSSGGASSGRPGWSVHASVGSVSAAKLWGRTCGQ